MQMPGRSFTSGDGYRYGFNGMERDDEVKGSGNSYDFGARMLDPRLGRWFKTDPYEEKYPSLSPYTAFGNNPIYYIDPSGETLRVAGSGDNFIQAKLDMYGLLPPGEAGEKYEALLTFGNDGTVQFNITKAQAEASGDVGVEYLHKITSSPSNYQYSADDKASYKFKGSSKQEFTEPNGTDPILNVSQNDKYLGGMKGSSNRRPFEAGIDAKINIPNIDRLNIKNRRAVVLHEIIEAVESQDKGKPYFSFSSEIFNLPLNMAGDCFKYPCLGSHDTAIDAVINGTESSTPIDRDDPRFTESPGK
jgi:RHS repeat-associated protein